MTLLPQELLKGSPWYVVSVRAVQCHADLLHLQLLLLHFHYILFHNGFKSLLKVVVLLHYWLVIYSKMLGHENLNFSTLGSYGLTPEILGRISWIKNEELLFICRHTSKPLWFFACRYLIFIKNSLARQPGKIQYTLGAFKTAILHHSLFKSHLNFANFMWKLAEMTQTFK